MPNDQQAPSRYEEHNWWIYLDPVRHLPTRYALILAGIGIALTFVSCYVAGILFEQKLRNTFGSRLESLAFQISDKLDRGMNERYRELQLVAGNMQIRDTAVPAADKRRILTAMESTLPDYAWIGFADAEGKVIAGTRGWMEDTNVADLAWFENAKEQPTAGTLHVLPDLTDLLPGSNETKPRFIAVSSPVLALNVKFAGVLGAYVNWPWVRQTVASIVPETLTEERIMVTIYDLNGKVLLDSHTLAHINQTAPLAAPKVPSAHEYRGFMVEDAADGLYLTGYIRSRGYQGFHHLNWFFAVRQPVNVAFAPVGELQRSIILTGFGLSAVVGIIGWVFALSTTRRLRAVTSASDRIFEGDSSSLIPTIETEDEMTRMSSSLNRLIQDLRDRNAAQSWELKQLKTKSESDAVAAVITKPALTPDEEARALNPSPRRPKA